jgi:hypothetical protein
MSTMQYDVKSTHSEVSGVMVPYRVRLKGAVIQPQTGAEAISTFVDNNAITGTYARSTTTATVTAIDHQLNVGQRVYLDWNLTDGPYTVLTVANANTFTVAVADSGGSSGAVIVYNVLFEIDTDIQVVTNVVIPGEGILARSGIRVFLASNCKASIFYG